MENKLEEARKRDHNKLGRELEYFTTSELIGQGLPILLPAAAVIIAVILILRKIIKKRRNK